MVSDQFLYVIRNDAGYEELHFTATENEARKRFDTIYSDYVYTSLMKKIDHVTAYLCNEVTGTALRYESIFNQTHIGV